MNRLTEVTKRAKKEGRKLFCAYITAGYPSLKHTEKLVIEMEKVGVDIIELGFPFSDPLADGPIIQKASSEAIKKGLSQEKYFSLVKRLRKKGVQVPIIFFTYYNPVFHAGEDKVLKKLKASGFDGVLCPDIPYGVDEGLAKKTKKLGLSYVRLIAPNTTKTRARQIAAASDDFVYYVARKGITGKQQSLSASLSKELKVINSLTNKAVLVGFGVSSKEQVKTILKNADGVIVGSAIVQRLIDTKSVRKTADFTKQLVKTVH